MILLHLLSLAQAADWPTHTFVALEVDDDLTHRSFGLAPPPYDPAIAIPSAPTGGPGIAAFAEEGLRRMDAGGLPAPELPVLDLPGTGPVYQVLWAPVRAKDLAGSPMYYTERRDAIGGQSFPGMGTTGYLFGNTSHQPLANIETGYVAGGLRRRRLLSYFGTNLLHETVHAVQAAATSPEDTTRAWVGEGVAEGVGAHLSMRTLPDLPELYENWLHRRSFRRSLHDDPSKGYGTASFWRYLAEAWERPGRDGLTLFPDLIGLTAADHASDAALYKRIDAILRERTGRPMNQIFAEFLTEYASYGDHRHATTYNAMSKTATPVPITQEAWLQDVFGGCATVTLTPGDITTVPLEIAPVAGACVQVDWSGFSASAALQVHAVGTEGSLDGLFIGEAVATRARRYTVPESCWEVTEQIPGRLEEPARAKCMLNRQTMTVDGRDVATFALGEALTNTGTTVLVLTNAADDIARTPGVKLSLVVGAADAKAAQGAVDAAGEQRLGTGALAALSPMETVEQPLQHGYTNLRGQVHLMAMGDDRMLIDGMPSFAMSRSTLFAPGDMSGGDKGLMLRTREYMVVVMADGQGSMILKNPMNRGGMRPPVSSVGSELEGVAGACGYQLDVQTTVLEDALHLRRVRLEADLFDPMALMGGSQGCAGLKAAWVERAVVEVTLPLPGLYDRGPLRRVVGPTQRRIDEEFGIGPFLGGIAASESLRVDGPIDPARLQQIGGPPPSAPTPARPPASGPPAGPPAGPSPQGPALDPICRQLGDSGVFAQPMEMVVEAALQAAEAQGCLCALKAQLASGQGQFGTLATTRLRAAEGCDGG